MIYRLMLMALVAIAMGGCDPDSYNPTSPTHQAQVAPPVASTPPLNEAVYGFWFDAEPDWCLYQPGDRVQTVGGNGPNGLWVHKYWKVYRADDPEGAMTFRMVVHEPSGKCTITDPLWD